MVATRPIFLGARKVLPLNHVVLAFALPPAGLSVNCLSSTITIENAL